MSKDTATLRSTTTLAKQESWDDFVNLLLAELMLALMKHRLSFFVLPTEAKPTLIMRLDDREALRKILEAMGAEWKAMGADHDRRDMYSNPMWMFGGERRIGLLLEARQRCIWFRSSEVHVTVERWSESPVGGAQ